jgi:hypothetical protein
MIAFVPRVDVLTVDCPHLGQGAGLVPDVSSGAAGGVPADGDRVAAARLMLRPGWDGVRLLAPASLVPGAGCAEAPVRDAVRRRGCDRRQGSAASRSAEAGASADFGVTFWCASRVRSLLSLPKKLPGSRVH